VLCVKRSNEPTPLAGEPIPVTSGLRCRVKTTLDLAAISFASVLAFETR
jgi:hypothetical protein